MRMPAVSAPARPCTASGAWQIMGRRIRAARERIQRDRAESLLDPPYAEAAGNVRELYKLRALLDELIDAEIIRGRELGAPWDLLGSSRQQAQQRTARTQRRQRPLTDHACGRRDTSTPVDRLRQRPAGQADTTTHEGATR